MVVVQMVVVVATVVAVEAATKAVQYNPGSLIRAPGVNNSPGFWLPDIPCEAAHLEPDHELGTTSYELRAMRYKCVMNITDCYPLL